MKLNIQPISQRNPTWKDKKLGTSSVSTIGNYGCLLTCGAMVCNYFGKETDPAKLNDEMVKVKGFYNGSYWTWGKLTEVYNDISFDWDVYNKGNCQDIPAPLDLIDKLLEERIPVIVQVDFSPGGAVEEHWVLVKGKEGDYLINDPWTGEEYFFTAKYGDPKRYIFAIRAYRGPIENKFHLIQGGVEVKTYDKHPDDTISDLEKKVESLNDQVATAVLENDELRKQLKQQEEDNKDLSEQLFTARTERDKAVREKKDLEGKAEDLSKRLDSALAEQTRLTEALAASSGLKIDSFSTKELIIEIYKRLVGRK